MKKLRWWLFRLQIRAAHKRVWKKKKREMEMKRRMLNVRN